MKTEQEIKNLLNGFEKGYRIDFEHDNKTIYITTIQILKWVLD